MRDRTIIGVLIWATGVWALGQSVEIDGSKPEELDSATRTAVETITRLRGINLEANAAVKTAVMNVLEKVRGRPEFVEIVRQFNLPGQGQGLLEVAIAQPDTSVGVAAMRLVLESESNDLLKAATQGEHAGAVVEALGNTGSNDSLPLLEPLLSSNEVEVELRKKVVAALAKSRDGCETLLDRAATATLPPDVKLLTGSLLNRAQWPQIKAKANELLPPPAGADDQPLPPISELIKMKGDIARGAQVFFRPEVTCSTCHQVNQQGTNFGPDLSEIGAKLGKDALFESILDPSAGISFDYEGWMLEIDSGEEPTGLIVSESEHELALKLQSGIVTRYPKERVISRRKMQLSVMPPGLQQTMSLQEFVDLVEYLSSLKKKTD